MAIAIAGSEGNDGLGEDSADESQSE